MTRDQVIGLYQEAVWQMWVHLSQGTNEVYVQRCGGIREWSEQCLDVVMRVGQLVMILES